MQAMGDISAHSTCKVMVVVSGLREMESFAYPKPQPKYQSRQHLRFLDLVFSALQQRAAVQTNRTGNFCDNQTPLLWGFSCSQVISRMIPCNGLCQFA